MNESIYELDISISIVILSHNRIEDIKINLSNILKANRELLQEIIIVDNASNDGTIKFLEKMEKLDDRIITIYNSENKGVAGGRNAGFKISKCDIIVSLDDDSYFDINDIDKVKLSFKMNPLWGIMAFKIRHQLSGDDQNNHGEVVCEIANHHGAGFAIRREVALKAGFIDELCRFGAEEIDLAIKVHNAQYKIIYNPDIIVFHNNIIKIGNEGLYRRNMRVFNNVRTYFKYFPFITSLVFSVRYYLIMLHSSIRDYSIKALFDFSYYYIKGAISGINKKHPVRRETVEYYKNPHLLPEHGNIPLCLKLRSRKNKRVFII